jgi:hypothetical protein
MNFVPQRAINSVVWLAFFNVARTLVLEKYLKILVLLKVWHAFRTVFKVIIVFLNTRLKISLENCKFIQVLRKNTDFFGKKFRANTEFLSRRVGF